jgi:hypothetical protein
MSEWPCNSMDFPTSALNGGELSISRFTPGTHWIGGWGQLVWTVWRKCLCRCPESNPIYPVVQPVAQSPYWLTYPNSPCNEQIFFFMAQKPLMDHGLLIIEASQSHSYTPHSVGLLWTSDQPDADTSSWQHRTLTSDRQPCPRRDSNP